MANATDYKVALVDNISQSQMTFASGSTTSSILTCARVAPVMLHFPSTFTSGNITFLHSRTPTGTFDPITNTDGSAFAIAVTASMWLPLLPSMFNGVFYLQLSCSASQSSASVIDVSLAPLYQGIHA